MTIRTALARGARVRQDFSAGGRTKQSMAAACDINLLMLRYLRSGTVDHVVKHGGSYGYASAVSFHESMNIVAKANEMFADLSAEVRKRFGNSPELFLRFVQDEKNLVEARELGLALPAKPAPAKPEPLEVRVLDPVKPAGTVAS